jgi:hypothetical protein
MQSANSPIRDISDNEEFIHWSRALAAILRWETKEPQTYQQLLQLARASRRFGKLTEHKLTEVLFLDSRRGQLRRRFVVTVTEYENGWQEWKVQANLLTHSKSHSRASGSHGQ